MELEGGASMIKQRGAAAVLERTGRDKDTIVVLISDHGYHLGEHSMWGKVTLFEECARVPMIVRIPGQARRGTQSESLVEVMPTLCQLCDIPLPKSIQGRSFVETLENPRAAARESAYTVVTRGALLGRSIRTARWRYAEWGSPTENELYDLAKDPAEQMNLARRPAFEETVLGLRKELRQRAESSRIARLTATDPPRQ